jgi:hypothetical protein
VAGVVVNFKGPRSTRGSFGSMPTGPGVFPVIVSKNAPRPKICITRTTRLPNAIPIDTIVFKEKEITRAKIRIICPGFVSTTSAIIISRMFYE